MNTLLIVIFITAYAAIAFEYPLKVNKGAPALVGAGLLWTIYAAFTGHVEEQLNESISGIAQIIFFLMGAMTIVELVDTHDGQNHDQEIDDTAVADQLHHIFSQCRTGQSHYHHRYAVGE